MNTAELGELIWEKLGDLANLPGGVLYSGLDTLTRPGDFYIVGLNPAGKPNEKHAAIRDNLAHESSWSAYTRDCWQDDTGGCAHKVKGRVLEKYLTRHQRHAIVLFNALACSPEETFSTNCVFALSENAKYFERDTGSSLAHWENTCWPVHQAFLSHVRPKWIISFGFGATTSAFGFWRRRSGNPPWTQVGGLHRGGWTYDASLHLGDQIAPLKAHVLGVPHPSYHAIGDDLRDFIRRVLVDGR